MRNSGLVCSVAWLACAAIGQTDGQYLIVLPAQRLVAVRMKIAPADGDYDDKRFDYFKDFEQLVRRLPNAAP